MAQASVFVLFLSPGALHHPPVVFQLCVATLLGRPIRFLHDGRAVVPAPGADRTNVPKSRRMGLMRHLSPLPIPPSLRARIPQAAGSSLAQAAGCGASSAASRPEAAPSLSSSQSLPMPPPAGEEVWGEKSSWATEGCDCYVVEAPGRILRCDCYVIAT